MSCPHGNPHTACDICDEIDTSYALGLKHAPEGFVLIPELATEEMVNAVISAYPNLHPSDVAEIYGLLTLPREPRQDAITHYSDCATHNMPAMPNGPCDCGGIQGERHES